MSTLKKLAAALVAITALTTAASGSASAAGLGMVDFTLLEPVACRSFDDAIEASKFNSFDIRKSDRWLPQIEFVKRHQADSKFIKESDYTRRVPSEHDCVVVTSMESARGIINGNNLTAQLISAEQIKMTAPNLPSGMIAVCAVNYGFRMMPLPPSRGGGPPQAPPSAKLPEADCTGTEDPEKTATGYWIVAKPKDFMRNFDLPK